MGNLLISLILAAGVAGFVYSKMGRRIGYGNEAMVWKMTLGALVVAFFVIYTLLRFVLNFKPLG